MWSKSYCGVSVDYLRMCLMFLMDLAVLEIHASSLPDNWRDFIPAGSPETSHSFPEIQGSSLPDNWRDFIPAGAPETSLPYRADLFEGDIMLPKAADLPEGVSANAINDPRHKWPDGKVYYVIDGALDSHEKGFVDSAMRHISDKSCITFHRRTNQPNFLRIINTEPGCWSWVGYLAKPNQELNLQKGKCGGLGTAVHELLHALGFHHEQSRSDRNDYVRIFFENIEDGMADNFAKQETNNQDFSYDYGSIMHYAWKDASKNGLPTILPIQLGKTLGRGRDSGMSETDIAKLNKLYSCSTRPGPAPKPDGRINWNGKNWAHNCDFWGNDIRHEVTDPELCGPKCQWTSDCTHFAYNPEDRKCWLKRGLINKGQALYKEDSRRVCGVRDETPPASIHWQGHWAHHCDFYGKDFVQYDIPPEQCGPKCQTHSECTHFAYNRKCFLKKGAITKDKAQAVADPLRVCGVRV
ncbi:hypothetical protein RvY_12529 [Ramazzottius varieornatus]|uniref:Metalloendopeptidase n=1 Tax=Ramazzottius varieornatus TaxID=947166 RepID=A0A1D1VJV1_RAMVA|nr:hypothetical protein RvY_12529 [Ramazzottius varieornatus]